MSKSAHDTAGGPHPLRRRGARGFTLVEMMIALLIASVLMMLAAPSMQDFLRNNRLQTVSLDMFRSLQIARSEAVKRRTRVLVCHSADPAAATPSCGGSSSGDWSGGWLVFVSGDGNDVYDDGVDQLLRVGRPGASDMSLIANAMASTVVIYDADGSTTAPGTVRFALCDARGSSHGRQVNLVATGRPSLVSARDGATVNCTSPT